MRKIAWILIMLILAALTPLARSETVEIAGQTYAADLRRMDLTRVRVDDAAALEAALCAMPRLEWVDLSCCGLDNETLAALRQRMAQRGVQVVWTLRFGKYTLRTDATAFSTLRSSTEPDRLIDRQVSVLQYATALQALDLGHNWILDISWARPLENLRVVILSDNRISDLSPLDGKPLEYLEAFNNRVSDISFLADCDTLIDLNLCHNRVTDLSALDELPNLRRVWMGDMRGLVQQEIDRFLALRGDDLEAYNFFTLYPTLYGWRTDEKGVNHPRYAIIRTMFREGVYYSFDAAQRPEQPAQPRKSDGAR